MFYYIIFNLATLQKFFKNAKIVGTITLNNGKRLYLVAKGERFGYAFQRISAHLFFSFVFVFIQKFLIPKAEKDNKL